MIVIPHFVFPQGSGGEIIDRATAQLAAYLTDPTGASVLVPYGEDGAGVPPLSPDLQAQAAMYADLAGAVGLADAPQFVIRPGGGTPGDEPITSPSEIIFGNDDKPAVPYVRLVVDDVGTPESWGAQALQRLSFSVDSYADEWQGLLTSGQDAKDATAILGGAVWALLAALPGTTYPLLKTWGFTNPSIRGGAPQREDIEMFHPVTLSFDIYYSI